MTVFWFDPIGQRMRRMPADKPPVEIYNPIAASGGLSSEHKRVWDAVVATATSTTMATPTPAEDEEICF
jgi:hypothetical protein